ncbi:MAG: YkvA family protein [Chloroflexota bacterium]
MNERLERWRQQARRLKLETYTLYLAYRDPRLPWPARIAAACVVGYAFSPIDLIPDFVPLLGYLDDLILLPLGVKLALSLIPEKILEENRVRAQEIIAQGKPVNRIAGIVIIAIWLVIVVVVGLFLVRLYRGVAGIQ